MFLYGDHTSNYAVLLQKANKSTIEIKKLQRKATEYPKQ